LENMEKVDIVCVDKTGTLTEGKPVLTDIYVVPEFQEDDVLAVVASLEKGSEHPVASAVVTGAREKGLEIVAPSNFEAIPGHGVRGNVSEKSVIIGTQKLLNDLNVPLLDQDLPHQKPGGSQIYVAIDGKFAGVIEVADVVKANAKNAVESLQHLGIQVVMVTGDNAATAHHVADQVGIKDVHAGVLPEGKAEIVRELKKSGKIVAMAGDGINDAPALANADVGIAMGTGTDIAIENGGITLLKGDIQGIVRARRLSRATLQNIRQNLFFAFIYNGLGVPIAAGVLYPFLGVMMSPMLAAAAMSLSSVSVIGNALRLNSVQIGDDAAT
jgi:Cu+-exporting ATPase